MKLLGILGGVASGKSTVAGEFARLGAEVLDADRAGHEVLRLPEIEAAARRQWGDGPFGPDGRIDRQRLAGIVFAAGPDGARQRKFLEQLTHPEIGRAIQRQAEVAAAKGIAAAVLDAPLLWEAGWNGWCDKIVFVDVPRDERLRRAAARGWTREEFAAREAAQESLECKRGGADWVIDNSGPPEQTRTAVERLWASLVPSG
jgi:dephospho-CoA kinase